jgi:heat shock protein HslJ
MKKILLFVVLVCFVVGVSYLAKNKKPDNSSTVTTEELSMVSVASNATYVVGTEAFILKDGKAEKEIVPGSATKNTLMLFGQPVMGDLDADGDTDAAVLLVNNPGGSAVFYYAALLINNGGVYTATPAMLLGDRIAPQNIVIQDGRAVYNFAERKAGEPMTTAPSVGKSIWVNFDVKTGQIGEWVKGFEGEANPTTMKLNMKTWQWISTTYSDGTKILPKDIQKFKLTFKNDGTFSSSTDCNGVGGNYAVKGMQITFSQMMGTMMYCDGSQEADFTKILTQAQSYSFTAKGELVFSLKANSGSAIFR